MGYTFKKITFPRSKPVEIQKATPEALVLRKLRRFLDRAEPDLVFFLVTLWKNENRAITFKELREAILAGDLSAEVLEEWRQDYALFVAKHMKPAWEEAIETAVKEMLEKYPEWRYDPMADGIRNWTSKRSADFVTYVTENQIQAIRAVVQKAAVLNELNVDTLARAIRPLVGLYHGQAVANFNYFQKLIEGGVSEKRALDLSARYAGRQIRYRAMMISRQELAMAYNTGAHEAIKQAQAAGYIKDAVKVACCADDERVCPICGALDGAIVGLDAGFSVDRSKGYRFTTLYPPFHIGCRCTVMYEIIE